MKTAICSKILSDLDLEAAVKVSAQIGYEGVEIFGFERHLPQSINPDRLKKTKSLLDSLGIKVVCIATYLGRYSQISDSESEKQFNEFKKYVDIAKLLESLYIRQWCGGPSPQKASIENWKKAAHWLKKAGEYASAFGIKVVLETQSGTLIETVEASLKLLEMVSHKSVMLTYDPANIYTIGKEYGESEIQKLKGVIAHVHLKDMDLEADERYRILGDGKVDLASVINGLRAIGYDGYIAADCHKTPNDQYDSIDIAKHEYERLKTLDLTINS